MAVDPLHKALALAARLLLPGGSRARLSILVFHSVVPESNVWRPGSITRDDFDRLVGFLALRFNVLPLEDAVRRLFSGRLPPASVAISFDDGYLDNRHLALPVLLEHGVTATFFIATGALDGGLMWNDRIIEAFRLTAQERLDLGSLGLGTLALDSRDARIRAYRHCIRKLKYLPAGERAEGVARVLEAADVEPAAQLMMDRADVRALHAAGMSIGAHTVTHPILAKLDEAQARQEMLDSRAELADLLGAEVPLFAYPNGMPGKDFERRDARLAREAGFMAAVTTASGVSSPATDPHLLPRFTPWSRAPGRFGLDLMRNGHSRSAPAFHEEPLGSA